MSLEEFLKLPATRAQGYLLTLAYEARAEYVEAYRNRHGVNLEFTQQSEAHARGSALVGVGWTLVVAGLVVGALAFYYDVGVSTGSAGTYGVPDRVANTDRIALRHMLLASGLASFVSGWIALTGGLILNAMRRPPQEQ